MSKDIGFCSITEDICRKEGECESCSLKHIYENIEHYANLHEQGRLVEVIRCKDCDHYDTYGCGEGAGWCEVNEVGKFDNGYCDNAKLKELEGVMSD